MIEPLKKDLVNLREMVIEDCSAVAEIEQALGATKWGQGLFEGEFKMARDHRTWFVALSGSKIVGFAGVAHVLGEANILNIGVTSENQRFGIGRLLVERLLEVVHSKQCNKLLLEVETTNLGAINLYESFGFNTIDIRADYYGKGRDAQVMGRKLT